MKKLISLGLMILLLSARISPAAAYVMAQEYLCEIGVKFYQQGRYEEAMREFKKALLVDPAYTPALNYIKILEQKGKLPAEPLIAPKYTPKEQPQIFPETEFRPAQAIMPPAAPPSYKILYLDETLKEIIPPINIAQGKSIIISGENIQRFLLTQPEILDIQRRGTDELLVTGKEIGHTYLHVWDDNGRWTTEWLGVFPEPEGPTYEELIRREEEKARNFKFRYTLSWSSFETGRRMDELNRSTYSWAHGLTLNGPTPYGDFDWAINMRKLRASTDLSYLTVGLTKGKFGMFKDFTLRAFDFYPYFSNLAFPSATLRGAMFITPMFGNKLEYTAFWGREGGGRYGNLSPGLTKTKHSFLEGFNLNYSPDKKQNYKFTVAHGWGRDRQSNLNAYSYDLSHSRNFDKWGWNYEVAQDSETFAHLFNAHYNRKGFSLISEFRNIDKQYLSITGTGWRQGEFGGLVKLNYAPSEKFTTATSLNVYQTRLFPAPDNDDRWNEDASWDANYKINDATTLNTSYALQNDLGSISESRYQNAGLGVSRKFKFIRDISSFVNYYHQENKSFSSSASNYINNRLYSGMRFSLIGQLYYYLNYELNYLEARTTAIRSRPLALETGIDFSEQIGKTPFYETFRFTFRDEENTDSELSFLSGEDYIEGYTELSFRPNADVELYGSTRVRNVWQENPAVSKRIEASFNAGMRYLWDTGVHWESVGNVEGYVFNDLNSDGLRQKDEPPVKGIKIWLGKDKAQVTDVLGDYKFKGIKAAKAYITLDTTTLPAGYILTVPVTQEAAIRHNQSVRVDFGIISHSEISGFIFVDTDNDGQFSKDDIAISGIIVTLEDGRKTATDSRGRYAFTNLPTGDHTITVDLNSIPVKYLPQAPLTKKATLFEGVTYLYNVPLKEVKK